MLNKRGLFRHLQVVLQTTRACGETPEQARDLFVELMQELPNDQGEWEGYLETLRWGRRSINPKLPEYTLLLSILQKVEGIGCTP